MTYGGLKLRLTQAFPGISLDLIEGWANDRYQEILAELPWFRQKIQAVLQTRAPYTTGTVSVAAGSSAITLAGGAWNSGMIGFFRVTGQNGSYKFTYASPTTGNLDRPYDGPTATGAGYSIYQTIYMLPADCRLLDEDAFCSPSWPMKRFTHEQISASDPTAAMNGTPAAWAQYMDDGSTPPRIQVQIWPIPDAVHSLPYTYQSTGGDLTSEATILQVWMQPAALHEGCVARIKAHLKDYQGATFHAALAEKALKVMRGAEANGLANGQMGLSSYYVGYRSRRYNR